MMKTRPRRRRFLQFSLRTVLVLMTVLAVWLGTWLDRGRREKAALEGLQDKGYVRVHYDYQWDANGKRVTNPSPPGPEWARQCMGEHCFTRVVRMSTTYYHLDDEGLSHVAQFGHLRMLYNDVGMVSAGEFRSMWSSPNNYAEEDGGAVPNPITDTGVAHLRRLNRLRTLILVGTVVTDDGLRHITGLSRLKTLKISSPNITDEGIPHLLRLKKLEDLCISGTSISEAGVAELRRGLPNCEIVGSADAKR
jgi:hypothetical protein